jgi:hypothetical protein
MVTENLFFRRSVLLTFQVSLLGMVPANLRGVTVGWTEKDIRAIFFFDQCFGDVEWEIVSDVEGEIMASFPDHEIRLKGIRLDFPHELNTHTLQAWVYRRKEY